MQLTCDEVNLSLSIYCVSVEFYKKADGKAVAVMDGYTYYCRIRSKATDRWQCTNYNKCKAGFIANRNREVIRTVHTEHGHPPPHYVIRNGVFLRI